ARALKDEHSTIVCLAVDHLGAMGPQAASALPLLAEKLQDYELPCRLEVAVTLEKIAPGKTWAIRALAEMALDEDEEATTALAGLGPAAGTAVPILVKALNDPDEDTRGAACQVLAKIGPRAKGAVWTLQGLMHDESFEVRIAAREALWRIAPGQVDRDLPEVLGVAGAVWRNFGEKNKDWNEENSWVPVAATEEQTRILLGALEDESPAVRINGVIGLIAIAPEQEQILPTFVAMMDDMDPTVRLAATLGTGLYAPTSREAFDTLVQRCKHRDPIEAGAAAASLFVGTHNKVEQAAPYLSAALEDREVWIRRLAVGIAKEELPSWRSEKGKPVVD
ncbi:MAG: HEAT repeat domain-containing protein, partial [Vicinamibacteria bacterium]